MCSNQFNFINDLKCINVIYIYDILKTRECDIQVWNNILSDLRNRFLEYLPTL